MKPIAISLQEAIDQGSTAGQMASVAAYHYKLAHGFNAEMRGMSRMLNGRHPTGAQNARIRELRSLKNSSDILFNHFEAMASAMRTIERT